MRPVLCVSAVIPVLVGLSACCGKQEERSSTFEFLVDEIELAEHLDADGNLTAEGCEVLCRENTYGMDIHSIDSCGEIPATEVSDAFAPSTASTGTTGDTGSPLVMTGLSCTVTGTDICVGGRDHHCIEGHHSGTGPTALAAWLGAQAHAEATSVKAFVTMGQELRRFGAPDTLVTRCVDAARDEVAHARILRRLCGERGGKPAALAFGAVEERSLLAFALENAVEGCVRETCAALLAAWQAQHAEQADVRAAYARIADDEARHGDLAWAIDAWLQSVLSDAERALVDAARRRAIDELLAGVTELDGDLRTGAGLPDRQQTLTLLHRLDEALWTPAMAA